MQFMPSPQLGKLMVWISQLILLAFKYPTVNSNVYFLEELSAVRGAAWRRESLWGLVLVNTFCLVDGWHWRKISTRLLSMCLLFWSPLARGRHGGSGRGSEKNCAMWDSSACKWDKVESVKQGGASIVAASRCTLELSQVWSLCGFSCTTVIANDGLLNAGDKGRICIITSVWYQLNKAC